MDLWFDPSRQVIVDKNNWKDPYFFHWFPPVPVLYTFYKDHNSWL